jgi:hypothetical protein
MTELFHLAFLLTADVEDAERCLICTIRECMGSYGVFKQWLPVWVRCKVVKNGIEIVTGAFNRPPQPIPPDEPDDAIPDSGEIAALLKESAGVLILNDDERLVYVLSMIEQYPLRDCALLLGKSAKEVRDARVAALERIAAFETGLHSTINLTPVERPCLTSPLVGADFAFSCGSVLE